MSHTHTTDDEKKARCGLKLKRLPLRRQVRIVEERPSCGGCQKKRPVLRTGKLDRCKLGRWTSKGWVKA